MSTLSEREKDQNVVTLSTLHAAKGLEWPHVMLVGINEDLLPFKPSTNPEDGELTQVQVFANTQRIEEERRLMYVGITRAQFSLVVSWCKRRKKGRDIVIAQPSRFIAEMAIDKTQETIDPMEKLRALRAELAHRASLNASSV